MNKLSAARVRKAKFCQALHAGALGWQAAKTAGYKGNKKNLEQRASKLLKDAFVQEQLLQLKRAGDMTAIATRQELLEVLTKHLRADLAEFVTDQGEIDVAAAKEAGKLGTLESFSISRTEGEKSSTVRHQVKLQSVQGAADRIARLLGFYAPEKHEVLHSQDLSHLTDEQLEQRARTLLAKFKAPGAGGALPDPGGDRAAEQVPAAGGVPEADAGAAEVGDGDEPSEAGGGRESVGKDVDGVH